VPRAIRNSSSPHKAVGAESFDRVADAYDRVRPGYPDEAVDDLIALSGVPRRGRVLEIGAGTGQLTVALAERGYRVTAVELGPALAERSRANLAGYADVDVVTGRFEDVELSDSAYDLVVAATSFHWLDPDVAYAKAARVLRPGGALGLLWNLHVDAHTGFFAAADEVYAEVAPFLLEPGISERMSEREARARDIESTGMFENVETRTYPWSAEYDCRTYLELISTYSEHIALVPEVRQRLDARLAELIDRRFGGRVEKGYQTVLYVANVRPTGAGGAVADGASG
jgi:SAM-dependent methyltransferase